VGADYSVTKNSFSAMYPIANIIVDYEYTYNSVNNLFLVGFVLGDGIDLTTFSGAINTQKVTLDYGVGGSLMGSYKESNAVPNKAFTLNITPDGYEYLEILIDGGTLGEDGITYWDTNLII
jgi:hypothetical protein